MSRPTRTRTARNKEKPPEFPVAFLIGSHPGESPGHEGRWGGSDVRGMVPLTLGKGADVAQLLLDGYVPLAGRGVAGIGHGALLHVGR